VVAIWNNNLGIITKKGYRLVSRQREMSTRSTERKQRFRRPYLFDVLDRGFEGAAIAERDSLIRRAVAHEHFRALRYRGTNLHSYERVVPTVSEFYNALTNK